MRRVLTIRCMLALMPCVALFLTACQRDFPLQPIESQAEEAVGTRGDALAGTIEPEVTLNLTEYGYIKVHSLTPASPSLGRITYRWQCYNAETGLWYPISNSLGNDASLYMSEDTYFNSRTIRLRRVADASLGMAMSNECTLTNYAFQDGERAGDDREHPFIAGPYNDAFTFRLVTNSTWFWNTYHPSYTPGVHNAGREFFTELTLECDMELQILAHSPRVTLIHLQMVDQAYNGSFSFNDPEIFYAHSFQYWVDYDILQTVFTEIEDLSPPQEPIIVPAGTYYIMTETDKGSNAGVYNGFVYMVIKGVPL